MIRDQLSSHYLAKVSEIKKGHVLVDTHAHPFELFYGTATYTKNLNNEGIYSSGQSAFVPPKLHDIAASEDERMRKIRTIFLSSDMASFTLGRLYRHTGPEVFRMHMELSCIDKVLLLPVVRPQDDINWQMTQMQAMFGGDERFALGWCVPESLADDEILPAARLALRRYGIQAVKLHPNITRIDPQSVQGARRIEAILRMCHKLKLPLIVHGGKSPQMGNSGASCYAAVRNLKKIEWGITNSPVVICHAGTYGCEGSEFRDSLNEFERLLARHRNMLVDISALEIGALVAVLKRLDTERIIFGSDMLYENQWATVVKLMIALETATQAPEEVFLKITSFNPQKYIFSTWRAGSAGAGQSTDKIA